ncbi:MAG: hypothetical protein IJ925_04485 [Muribaculaceae bacterium]|nr:hypothetical protein [Muribaculaceae bacterium]
MFRRSDKGEAQCHAACQPCRLLLATKQLNEASLDIASALELDPDDPFIYVLRAKLNKLRYNRNDMERDIRLAVAHGLSEDDVKQLIDE